MRRFVISLILVNLVKALKDAEGYEYNSKWHLEWVKRITGLDKAQTKVKAENKKYFVTCENNLVKVMKFFWIQFQLANVWEQPQSWKRFGATWNYIRLFNKTLLIIHGWGTIETAKLWNLI